jgi:hypothetical protein
MSVLDERRIDRGTTPPHAYPVVPWRVGDTSGEKVIGLTNPSKP